MRRYILLFTVLLPALIWFGCESGNNLSITGDYFDRSAGDLVSVGARFDSLTANRDMTGQYGYIYAGNYENIKTFSVLRFPIPSSQLLDSLESAAVVLIASTTWRNGDAGFDLYETITDWTDSTRLDSDDFTFTGTPASSYSDTAQSLERAEFILSSETIENMRTWTEQGCFAVTGSEGSNTIVSFNSIYSNDKPQIRYILRAKAGELDTTFADCIESNYSYAVSTDPVSSGSTTSGLLANAGAAGFYMKLAFPDSFPATATINQCILRMNIIDKFIPSDETFYVGFYELTSPMTTLFDSDYESANTVEQSVTETTEYFEVDITDIVDEWHQNHDKDFGMLVRPLSTGTSPGYVICAPSDSLMITYTALPEVE